jgi:ABC-type Fe3+-siderophore transport system permease subunit
MTRLLLAPKPHSCVLRLWVFALALCMLVSVFLGQLHASKHHVGHGGLGGGAQAAAARAAAHEAAHEAAHDHGFFEHLFSNHSEGADCRLYDQLSDGHTPPAVAAMFVPVVLPSVLVAIFAGAALARWAALFDARGPPLTV